jgi:hypothetical protein
MFTKKKYAISFKKRVEDLGLFDESYNNLDLEIIPLKLHDNDCKQKINKKEVIK